MLFPTTQKIHIYPLQRKTLEWCLPENHTKQNMLHGQNIEFKASCVITAFSRVHTQHYETYSIFEHVTAFSSVDDSFLLCSSKPICTDGIQSCIGTAAVTF